MHRALQYKSLSLRDFGRSGILNWQSFVLLVFATGETLSLSASENETTENRFQFVLITAFIKKICSLPAVFSCMYI